MPGCSYFKSSDSFAIVRGRHMDLTILGGLQVSQFGDLANWIIPGKMVKGMGGAMDLAANLKVIITMEHTAKGKPKILDKCTLPLTGKGVVSRLITELGVFDFSPEGMKLMEIFDGVTIDHIKSVTSCKFSVANDLKTIKF